MQRRPFYITTEEAVLLYGRLSSPFHADAFEHEMGQRLERFINTDPEYAPQIEYLPGIAAMLADNVNHSRKV